MKYEITKMKYEMRKLNLKDTHEFEIKEFEFE